MVPSRSDDQRHQPLVLTVQITGDTVPDAAEMHIGGDLADAHAAYRQAVYADRQPRPVDDDLACPAIDAQAEAGLQEHERRAGRPGLRQAGDGIGYGSLARRAHEA